MKKNQILYVLSGFGIVSLLIIILIYRNLFGVSIKPQENKGPVLIPTGATYSQVLDTLKSHLKIRNIKVLNWVAKKKNYPALIKPGEYEIKGELSYIGLINLLRSGRQTPVNVTLNNARSLTQLAGKIGQYIEADSVHIISFLTDESNFSSDGFTKENIITIFIPNTYEFYWNTDSKKLYSRMLKEYRSFWNEDRLAKAKEKALKPTDIAILASIIDDEAVKQSEKARIAGVYLNRLKRGIPLQADPTIRFALNDFSITRVLKKHLLIDSPYNTYKYKGLPPGPISCPSIEGIDAVLNSEKHDYLYFAAKSDFSGYHNFSRTLSEHNRYAALYQKELNKRKIFR
jgi:UPF0755 protein